MIASVSRILARNLFPSPSPLLAPFTSPAMSTISTVVGLSLIHILSFANVARENNYIRPVIEDNDVLDIRPVSYTHL